MSLRFTAYGFRSVKIFLADSNLQGIEQLAKRLNTNLAAQAVWTIQVDIEDWESQKEGFSAAVKECGRIDYVFHLAGIPEQPWLPELEPQREEAGTFVKPNLKLIEVNSKGSLYSAGLAIQQFRRQQPNQHGFRGKSRST